MMAERSLYQAAHAEAVRYREQVAVRMGAPFGDEAISEWNRLHWWQWACERVLEHVRGDVFWAEFDAARFASIHAGERAVVQLAADIQTIREHLDQPDLDFRDRRLFEERLADLVNQLLA